jgi:4-hydroxybenzoate polyprenyltransferase
MYREFFSGAWLGERPVFYALTHQLVLVPLSAYTELVAMPNVSFPSGAIGLSLLTVGAFFAYEVCRKLDPAAHPILRTYLQVHGRARVFTMVAGAMLVAGAGARMLSVAGILWPIEVLVPVSLLVIWFRPAAFALPETIAGFSLLAHLWVVPARHAVAGL